MSVASLKLVVIELVSILVPMTVPVAQQLSALLKATMQFANVLPE
jgi:hypothetical protein